MEDPALRACYTALRMQQTVKLYADEVERSDDLLVQIRVGTSRIALESAAESGSARERAGITMASAKMLSEF